MAHRKTNTCYIDNSEDGYCAHMTETFLLTHLQIGQRRDYGRGFVTPTNPPSRRPRTHTHPCPPAVRHVIHAHNSSCVATTAHTRRVYTPVIANPCGTLLLTRPRRRIRHHRHPGVRPATPAARTRFVCWISGSRPWRRPQWLSELLPQRLCLRLPAMEMVVVVVGVVGAGVVVAGGAAGARPNGPRCAPRRRQCERLARVPTPRPPPTQPRQLLLLPRLPVALAGGAQGQRVVLLRRHRDLRLHPAVPAAAAPAQVPVPARARARAYPASSEQSPHRPRVAAPSPRCRWLE